MKLAFLFPGQGSQRVGMGKELADDFAAARAVFEEADEAAGVALSRLCFEGPEEELRLTINTQPAMLTVGVAALRAFESEFHLAPEVAAGHSLGEYSALVASGAISLRDAVRAVRERGRLMQAAVPGGQGTMAALIGLDLQAVKEVCERASSNAEVVVPANLNAPGQVVVAGNTDAVRRAIELAKEQGASMSVELKVSAPFHCPLMKPARDGMAKVLASIEIKPLKFGVIANVTAEINRDSSRVVPLLLEQITAPVRWEDSMGTLRGAGVDTAIEFGCGRVLAGLMRRIDKNVKVHACEDPKSLKALTAALSAS